MSLSGLPTELLDSIIAFTLFQGFESVMLSCKTLYVAGKGRIPEYNALKLQWTDVVAGGPNQPRNVLEILRAIAHRPILAHLIKCLDLINTEGFHDTAPDIESTDEEGDELLSQMVAESEYIVQAGLEAAKWTRSMELEEPQSTGDDDTEAEDVALIYRTVFLLTLLPNLEALTLPARWSIIGECETNEGGSVLEVIMQKAHEHGDEDMALAKLQQLLPFQEIEYDSMPRGGLGVISTFMHLPRLTTLCVSDLIAVTDGYTGIPFIWEFAEIPCNLRKIDLRGCCVDHTNVSELLSNTPLVTSFKYSHHAKWHGCGHDWDAGAFVEAIGKHSGERLRELSLTRMWVVGDIETGVTDMQAFKVIEDLELDVAFFNIPASNENSMNVTEPNTDSVSSSRTLRLSDILPRSIKHVCLFVTSAEHLPALSQLFRDANDLRRSSRFPRLEAVTVQGTTIGMDEDGEAVANELAQAFPMALTTLLQTCGVEIL